MSQSYLQSEREMKIRIKNLPHIKNNEFDDVYSIFIDNWDQDRLDSLKEAKALFLNDKKEIFAICDVPTDNDSIPLEKRVHPRLDITGVFQKAKKANASSIIIAESRLPYDVYADSYRLKLFKKINAMAKRYNLNLDDFVSISNIASSSFKVQGLIK